MISLSLCIISAILVKLLSFQYNNRSSEFASSDIYNTRFISNLAGDEMIEVLRRDGYNLDRHTTTEPDCPDLDLVPPHVISERKSIFARVLCCDRWRSCSVM